MHSDDELPHSQRPTIPVPAMPGIPDHAPPSARRVAYGLDVVTGGSGSWALDLDEC